MNSISSYLREEIGPVPSKHGNLYNFATFPGYGRYFYISDQQGSLEGDKEKLHTERGDGCARRPYGRDGGA